MSTWDDRTLIEDILANGVDDWVYAAWLYQIAQRSGLVEPRDLRALSIGLIAEVLTSGLMVAGEYDGSGFRQWECSTGEAIVRITQDWLAWGDEDLTPGAVVWLDVTPAGQAIGEAVLAREK
ncbi:hypothetical protein [Frankia sp. CiP1_Cm_nod1]|uniref:hypothetical protein n=1 Tax=Frankia sp. CiP1_Cm_nod1 TaxID=2897160 RepID=UPI0020245EB2